MFSFQYKKKSHCGAVDKPLALYPGILRLIPGSSSLSGETLSCGDQTAVKGLPKLATAF